MIAKFSFKKERLLYDLKIARAKYFLSIIAFDSPIYNSIEK